MMDGEGNLINENDPSQERKGNVRTIRIKLDPAQYQKDLVAQQKVGGSEDPYSTINVVMRRKAKVRRACGIFELFGLHVCLYRKITSSLSYKRYVI